MISNRLMVTDDYGNLCRRPETIQTICGYYDSKPVQAHLPLYWHLELDEMRIAVNSHWEWVA